MKHLKSLKEISWQQNMIAIICSMLLVFICAYFYVQISYQKTPVYTELVAGLLIWDGYPKQNDITLIYGVLFGTVLSYFFFAILAHKFLHKTSEIQFNKLNIERFRKINLSNMLVVLLLGIEVIWSLEMTIQKFHRLSLTTKTIFDMLPFLYALSYLILWAILLKKCKQKYIQQIEDTIIGVLQILLPIQVIVFYRYQYEYQNEIIQLFYSGKLKYLCLLFVFAAIVYGLYRLIYRKNGISIVTVFVLSISRVLTNPSAICQVDFFHNGEMSVPMQQFVQYGQLPYWDIVPIHGLCDYYYGIFHYVLFDGTYLSYQAAIMVGNLVIAGILGIAIYLTIKNKVLAAILAYIFVPFFAQVAGVRYVLFFLFFFVLLSDYVRKDHLRYIWCYTVLCILGISYNVSIGSAAAVAFLPEALYRIVKVIPSDLLHFKVLETKRKKSILISYSLLFILLIGFIPLFLKIIKFLLQNTGTTQFVNGLAIFAEDFHFIDTFLFVVPLLVISYYVLKGEKKAKSLWIAMVLGMSIMVQYAFVRYDAGHRAYVLGIGFLYFCIAIICNKKQMRKNSTVISAVLICGILLLFQSKENVVQKGTERFLHQVINESETVEIMGSEVESPLVYLTGESVGMKGLGTGFISANSLNSLKNVQYVLQLVPEGSYLDFTNQLANYIVFQNKMLLPDTSVYNISNRILQQEALMNIKSLRPKLILLGPAIVFDEAPMSLRSQYLFQNLLRLGYKARCYENVLYLVDEQSDIVNISLNDISIEEEDALGLANLSAYMHKENLYELPSVYGKSYATRALSNELVVLDSNLPSFHILEDNQKQYIIWDEEWNGIDASYLYIKTIGELKGENVEAVLGEQENSSFQFESNESGEYLIPIGSSPYWVSNPIKMIEITGLDKIENITILVEE